VIVGKVCFRDDAKPITTAGIGAKRTIKRRDEDDWNGSMLLKKSIESEELA
jgi:hypothetical protein